MRLLFVGALSYLAVAMAAPIAGAEDLPAATYVHAGKLLDVRSGKMLSDQLIWMRGDRIERVVANGEVPSPPGSATIDLKPCYGTSGTDRLPYPHHAHGYRQLAL